jgi:hypothetical protein
MQMAFREYAAKASLISTHALTRLFSTVFWRTGAQSPVVAKFIGNDHLAALPASGHVTFDTANSALLNPTTWKQHKLAGALHCSEPRESA